MAEFVKEIESVAKETQSFAENQLEYIRLDLIDKSAKGLSNMTGWLILGGIAMITLLMVSVVAGIALSHWMGSYVTGFSVLSGFYFLILALGIIFRKKILTTPLRDKIIKNLLDKADHYEKY